MSQSMRVRWGVLSSPIAQLGHLPVSSFAVLGVLAKPMKGNHIDQYGMFWAFNTAQHYEIALRATATEISEWPQ